MENKKNEKGMLHDTKPEETAHIKRLIRASDKYMRKFQVKGVLLIWENY